MIKQWMTSPCNNTLISTKALSPLSIEAITAMRELSVVTTEAKKKKKKACAVAQGKAKTKKKNCKMPKLWVRLAASASSRRAGFLELLPPCYDELHLSFFTICISFSLNHLASRLSVVGLSGPSIYVVHHLRCYVHYLGFGPCICNVLPMWG